MMKSSVLGLLVFCACAVQAAERWTLGKPSVWTRQGTFDAVLTNSPYRVTHTGTGDWCLNGFPKIKVAPWESYTIEAEVRGSGSISFSVVTYDEKNAVQLWSYGSSKVDLTDRWRKVAVRLFIPAHTTWIMPRLMGVGSATVEIRDFALSQASASCAVQSGSVTLGKAQFFYDTTGFQMKVGAYATAKDATWGVVAVQTNDASGVAFTLVSANDGQQYGAHFHWEKEELCVSFSGQGELAKTITFPPALETKSGERLVVPENEGMSYPVDDPKMPIHSLHLYGGHGLCMSFFGVMRDADGAGWMMLVESPDDARMMIERAADKTLRATTGWEAQCKVFGYPRKARYVFFEKGGHVAMCKRYRAYQVARGSVKTFSEKVKERPAIDMLIGAANIWYMGGGDKVQIVREMQALGMERILWSGNGSPSELTQMNSMTNVLTSRYDIYSDVMDPANFPLIKGVHSDWTTDAFPHDITWDNGDGKMRRAWGVETKAGTGMVYCVSLCDRQALPYARKRVSEELKSKPFKCRFIDTATACSWQECYNPAHPMTRSISKEYRVKLLNVMSGEMGLVCGSETGHDAVVPVCDFFEGMLSIGNYRVPDSGRKTAVIWDDVPEKVEKFQVGEAYRLPLWELVYHDCVVAQWYWGDYNNKLPKIWRKRDLFNALYGTPPMYMFVQKAWQTQKEQFAASYKVTTPVARLTGYSEMVDHQILKADRTVQRTLFANGVHVTVNFGSAPFTTADGLTIPAQDVVIKTR